MLPISVLTSFGFTFYRHHTVAVLQVSDESYLYLEKKEDGWIIGHSTDGFSFFIRPGGNQRYQYINTPEELKLEIAWLKNYGAAQAIELSKALLVTTVYEQMKRNSNPEGCCFTKPESV